MMWRQEFGGLEGSHMVFHQVSDWPLKLQDELMQMV